MNPSKEILLVCSAPLNQLKMKQLFFTSGQNESKQYFFFSLWCVMRFPYYRNVFISLYKQPYAVLEMDGGADCTAMGMCLMPAKCTCKKWLKRSTLCCVYFTAIKWFALKMKLLFKASRVTGNVVKRSDELKARQQLPTPSFSCPRTHVGPSGVTRLPDKDAKCYA